MFDLQPGLIVISYQAQFLREYKLVVVGGGGESSIIINMPYRVL